VLQVTLTKEFENVIIATVIANTLLLSMQSFYPADSPNATVFQGFNYLFTSIFALEMAMKITGAGV
jgi:hypothetical protein